MRKLNILQVIPDLGLAGAEIMCENLSYHLHLSSKYNVFVCSLYSNHTAITERLERSGIKVFYLGKKKGLDLSIVYNIYKIIKEYQIDIIHTHLYSFQYAVPASIIAGAHVRIHTVHNIATKEFSYPKRKIAKFFYKYCNLKPVSISPIISNTIEVEYGIRREHIAMIFNGIDLKNCIKKDSYEIGKKFKFIHIGRMSYQKNHDIILQAAKKMKDENRSFIIYLIGAGEEEQRIRRISEELNINDVVSFCGLQSNVYPKLHESDCFILPSLYEGMPVSLVEAMGTGLPIIASAVGGIPDMIKNEFSGLLINPNSNELYTSMIKIMDEPSSYRKFLGENAKNEAEQFSLQNMGNAYEAIYQKEAMHWNLNLEH